MTVRPLFTFLTAGRPTQTVTATATATAMSPRSAVSPTMSATTGSTAPPTTAIVRPGSAPTTRSTSGASTGWSATATSTVIPCSGASRALPTRTATITMPVRSTFVSSRKWKGVSPLASIGPWTGTVTATWTSIAVSIRATPTAPWATTAPTWIPCGILTRVSSVSMGRTMTVMGSWTISMTTVRSTTTPVTRQSISSQA